MTPQQSYFKAHHEASERATPWLIGIFIGIIIAMMALGLAIMLKI